MLYSFSICEFLLESFSHKIFNETTCVMQFNEYDVLVSSSTVFSH